MPSENTFLPLIASPILLLYTVLLITRVTSMHSLITFAFLLSVTINLILFTEYLAVTEDSFGAISTYPIFKNKLFRLHQEIIDKSPNFKFLALSLYETADFYSIKTDLPDGVSNQNIFITLPTNESLSITAHWNCSKAVSSEADDIAPTIEVHEKKVTKTFSIPKGIKRDEISASIRDGALTILIPKPNITLLQQTEQLVHAADKKFVMWHL
jgi:HSP20 family molecular chaperone IbpA